MGTPTPMERTTLYEDDLTEERDATPVQREESAETLALDPDVDDDDADADDDEEDDDEDLDE